MGKPTDEGRRRKALEAIRPYIERAHRFSGWDFSALHVRPVEQEPPWESIVLTEHRYLIVAEMPR